MSLSRTVSEIDGDFSRKSQNIPTSCILHPAEFRPGAEGQKTRMMGLYRAEKEV